MAIPSIIGVDAAVIDNSVTLTPEQWAQVKHEFTQALGNGHAERHYTLEEDKTTIAHNGDFHTLFDTIASHKEMTRTPGGTLSNIFYNMRGVLLEHPCGLTLWGPKSEWPQAEFRGTEGAVAENVRYPLSEGGDQGQSIIVNVEGGRKRTFTNPGGFAPLLDNERRQDRLRFDTQALVWLTGSALNRLGDISAEAIVSNAISGGNPIAYNLPTSYPASPEQAQRLREYGAQLIPKANYVFGNIVELARQLGTPGATPDEKQLCGDAPAMHRLLTGLQMQLKPGAEALITSGAHGAYIVTPERISHRKAFALDRITSLNVAGDTTIGVYMALREARDDLTPEQCCDVAMYMAKTKIEESTGRLPPDRFLHALSQAYNGLGIMPPPVTARSRIHEGIQQLQSMQMLDLKR